jgi:hypothetical protein
MGIQKLFIPCVFIQLVVIFHFIEINENPAPSRKAVGKGKV